MHRSVLVTKAALRKGPALPQAAGAGQVPGASAGPQPCAADSPLCDGHGSQVTLAGHALRPWCVLLSSGEGRGQPCSAAGPAANAGCAVPAPAAAPAPRAAAGLARPGRAEGSGTAQALALCWDLPPAAAWALPAARLFPATFPGLAGSTHYRTLARAPQVRQSLSDPKSLPEPARASLHTPGHQKD